MLPRESVAIFIFNGFQDVNKLLFFFIPKLRYHEIVKIFNSILHAKKIFFINIMKQDVAG
jgi:hypothetical protein